MISLDRVSYAYPFQSHDAVNDVSLSIHPGEAVLITGASGCGKSTIVRLINGLCPHFFKGRLKGRISINGKENARRRLNDIAIDVGSLFQDPEHQFFATSVEDEIAFVHEWREQTITAIREKVDRAAAQFALTSILGQSVLALSEGQKQKVALAAVMSMNPRALVLDEPTANLDPESTRDLAQIIINLKQSGLAIVIVDHRLYWLESVIDRAIVMDRGRIVAESDFSVLAKKTLRRRYGLRQARIKDGRPFLKTPKNQEAEVQVEGLRFGYGKGPDLFNGVSFSLSQGVTGLLGKNGSGKTTLARLLTGLSRARCGQFKIKGEKVLPRQLLGQASIVWQNTDHQLFMKTVRDEVMLAQNGSRPQKDSSAVEKTLRHFGLADLAGRHPQSLSGGEKQRLVIACAMIKQPDIMILDEPTSGLDGRNMQLISDAIRMAAEDGACVLLISHDLELINLCCDHALQLPLPNTLLKKGDSPCSMSS
jgi:energy-coupling factor transport system ATP-binding protein